MRFLCSCVQRWGDGGKGVWEMRGIGRAVSLFLFAASWKDKLLYSSLTFHVPVFKKFLPPVQFFFERL